MNNKIQENIKRLNYYIELSFTNLYSCRVDGKLFEFYGYTNKIITRLRNNAKELSTLIKKEDLNEIKFFLQEELKVIDANLEENRAHCTRTYYKKVLFWNISMVKADYFEKIISEIEKSLAEKKEFNFAAIEKELISIFSGYDWYFRKTLAKTGKTYQGLWITPKLRKKKQTRIAVIKQKLFIFYFFYVKQIILILFH